CHAELAFLEQLGRLGPRSTHAVMTAEGDVDAQTAAFWEFWTVREAILKQQARSIWDMADIKLRPQPPYSDMYTVQHWSKKVVSIACCLARPAEVEIELLTHL